MFFYDEVHFFCNLYDFQLFGLSDLNNGDISQILVQNDDIKTKSKCKIWVFEKLQRNTKEVHG